MLDIDLVSQKESSPLEFDQTFGGRFQIKEIQVRESLLWISLVPQRDWTGRKRKWRHASISISLGEVPKIVQALVTQVNKSYEVLGELGILNSDSPGSNPGAELDAEKLKRLLKTAARSRK